MKTVENATQGRGDQQSHAFSHFSSFGGKKRWCEACCHHWVCALDSKDVKRFGCHCDALLGYRCDLWPQKQEVDSVIPQRNHPCRPRLEPLCGGHRLPAGSLPRNGNGRILLWKLNCFHFDFLFFCACVCVSLSDFLSSLMHIACGSQVKLHQMLKQSIFVCLLYRTVYTPHTSDKMRQKKSVKTFSKMCFIGCGSI